MNSSFLAKRLYGESVDPTNIPCHFEFECTFGLEAPYTIRAWVVGDWDFEFHLVFRRPVLYEVPEPYVSKAWRHGNNWYVKHNNSNAPIRVDLDDEDHVEENKEFLDKLTDCYLQYLTDSMLQDGDAGSETKR